jgi:prepilin-type N-terminal cleavage/methylation domain-containing protein
MQMTRKACSQICPRIPFYRGFTLIELLVVISVIAVLIAILVPVLGRAREVGQRSVCLSNLKQLTTAWLLYADDHDGNLVSGRGFPMSSDNKHFVDGWVNYEIFMQTNSQSTFFDNPSKGALWSYIQDVGVYHCPRALTIEGWAKSGNTYAILAGANGEGQDGTDRLTTRTWYRPSALGVRVGKTVLKLTNLKDIVSPGAAERGVFIDLGISSMGSFSVDYLQPRYRSRFPAHHAQGTTLSMADGHVEYWKWKGRETLEINRSKEGFDRGYWPETEYGLFDLQRMQKTMWGRLGYKLDNKQAVGP